LINFTIAVVLFSPKSTAVLISVSAPEYAIYFQRYPVLDSHNSKALIPNFENFRGREILKDNLPFYNVRDSSTAMFTPGIYTV
jgi:hypothetical protein